MNRIKTFVGSALIAVGLLLAPTPAVQAATWNDAFGMGNPNEDWQFTGSGALLSVVTSVVSNSLYYVASAKGAGAPRFERILVKPDLTGFNLDVLIATNVWTCASNQPAGTNIIWLTTTNAGLATNDLLVLRDVQNDCYQLLVLSGNATDAAGLVFTNGLGQCGIKVFNTPTNTIAANDQLYKMTRLARFNPLSDNNVTNKVLSPWGNWLNVSDLTGGQPINIRTELGLPAVVMCNFSNAAGLFVSGEYYVRPRR